MFTKVKKSIKNHKIEQKKVNTVVAKEQREKLFNNRVSTYDHVVDMLQVVQEALDSLDDKRLSSIVLMGRDVIVDGKIVGGYSLLYNKGNGINLEVISNNKGFYDPHNFNASSIPIDVDNHKIMYTVKNLSHDELNALDWIAVYFDDLVAKIDDDLSEYIIAETKCMVTESESLPDKIEAYQKSGLVNK